MRRRAGLGVILPIVMGLLIILLLGATLQLFTTGSSLHQAARDAGGAVAEQVASSAIEEALYHFQQKVNDPNSQFFKEVRKALMEGNESSLEITKDCDPELLRQELSNSSHSGFYKHIKIESFSVVMRIPTRADVEVKDDEKVSAGEQYIDLDCAVSLKLSEMTIWRRICARRRYGMTFISNYKPFDQLTFAIIRSGFLAAYPQVLTEMTNIIDNVNRAGFFLRSFGQMINSVPRVTMNPVFVPVGDAPEMRGTAQSEFQDALDEARRTNPSIDEEMGNMDEEQEGWFRWSLIVGRTGAMIDRPSPDEVVAFRPFWPTIARSDLQVDIPTADSIIFSVAPEVELEEFDYDKRLIDDFQPRLDDIKKAAKKYNDSLASLIGYPSAQLTPQEVRRFESKADQAGVDLNRCVRKAIEELNKISSHLGQHTRAGFTTETLRSYLKESSRRLRNLAYHIEGNEDIDKLKKSQSAFNGHMNYNGRKRLKLSLNQWKGKTIISGPYTNAEVAPITIEKLTTASKDKDLVVVNHANLHLRGESVDASIFAADRIFFEGEPKIFGNLIINFLRLREDRQRDEDLRGKVTYNKRCYSGEYLKRNRNKEGKIIGEMELSKVSLGHYTIGMCPRDVRKVVFRSPNAQGQPFEEGS